MQFPGLILLLLAFAPGLAQSGAGARFLENKGQLMGTDGNKREDILFYNDIRGGRLYFSRNSVSFVSAREEKADHKNITRYFRSDSIIFDARDQVLVEGKDELPGYLNYYLPQCPNGLTGVKQFATLVYKNLTQGIDLAFFIGENGDMRYRLSSSGKATGNDESGVLSTCTAWSTYYGGSGSDEALGIVADSNANSYTTGFTLSPDFPVTTGSFQDTVSGNYDAFVIKMDSCGNRLWTTFLGSSGNDFGEKVSLCGNDAIIAGHTTGNDLPVGSTAWQLNSNGSYDAFLFRLDPLGARVWATYFGGSGGELALGLATDSNKNIFLAGSTSSSDLPVQNAFQSIANGALDAYVAKFDSSGVRLWSTYYGGSGSEDVHALATDGAGNLVVVGGTFSTDLSISSGAFQLMNNGIPDGYISKFNPAGNRIFSTYFGGVGAEDINAVKTDAQGNIYFTGNSTGVDLPVTTGAYQSINNGMADMHITKFDSAGGLNWCTYFGGSGSDDAYSMATDQNGNFFILATTTSTDIPIIGVPLQANKAGQSDVFILKVSDSGQMKWSTFYGGTLNDDGREIFATPSSRLFITGFTSSVDFPVSVGSFQSTSDGSGDAFISSLDGSFGSSAMTRKNEETYLSVYPNPSAGKITFRFSSDKSALLFISITDCLGNKLADLPCRAHQRDWRREYSVDALPAGVYFAVFHTSSGIITKRMIISP